MDSRAENNPSFYLYVLECAAGTWFTGYTVDVAERVRAHKRRRGREVHAQPSSRAPARAGGVRDEARGHERQYRFKRLTRRQKERLVRRAAREPFERF